MKYFTVIKLAYKNKKQKGFLYLMVLFMIVVISVMFLKSFETWEYILQRDREQELIFRGNQYVTAIKKYQTKYPGAFPRSLKELYEKKFLRKLYKEPFSKRGKWNLVSISRQGGKSKFVVIPHSLWDKYKGGYRIVGVVSPVHKKGYKIYKKKEYYDEWLFADGIKDKIPEFIVIGGKSGD
jgi:type II secretory pathway pseudopilin PulG